MLKTYNEFITEKLKGEYFEGDIVLIKYYLTGDITPVKIIEKKSKNYYIVSHNTENSHIKNAPNQGIKISQIIGTSEPMILSDINNPNVNPLSVKNRHFSNDLYL